MPTPPAEDAVAAAEDPAAAEGSANPYYEESDEEEVEEAPAPAAPAPAKLPAAVKATKARAHQPMDVSKHPELLAEGYLTKVKGNTLQVFMTMNATVTHLCAQNRTRFFRLTSEKFTYYEENAGKSIASIPYDELDGVEDVSKCKFIVKFKTCKLYIVVVLCALCLCCLYADFKLSHGSKDWKE